MMNPVFPFEISVIDMDRAVGFYEAVIGYKLRRRTVDGYEMAFFPRTDGAPAQAAHSRRVTFTYRRRTVLSSISMCQTSTPCSTARVSWVP